MTSVTDSFVSDKEELKDLKLLLGSVWPQRGLDGLYLEVLPLRCGFNR